MSEYELVNYHELLSDVISAMDEHGVQRLAEDLVQAFKPQATELAFAILECARKKQVAALFKPPNASSPD